MASVFYAANGNLKPNVSDVIFVFQAGMDADLYTLGVYREWMYTNKLEVELLYSPTFMTGLPYGVRLFDEDAIAFKLKFGL